jgi:hypothetical protein
MTKFYARGTRPRLAINTPPVRFSVIGIGRSPLILWRGNSIEKIKIRYRLDIVNGPTCLKMNLSNSKRIIAKEYRHSRTTLESNG